MISHRSMQQVLPERPSVALAILHQDGKFLMQLRDDEPTILYPGHWAFFGGHIEPGESADAAIERELLEEIGYCPPQLSFYERSETIHAVRYIYYGALDADLSALILGEGMDMELVTPADVDRGVCYSKQINQMRPLGEPHRQILLNFIKTVGW